MPFYSELGRRVRDAGAKYIVQLAFSGRQRDIPSVVYDTGLSSTDKPDPDPRLPLRADDEGTDRRDRRCFRAGGPPGARGGAGRDRGARLQRLPHHPVPLLRHQRPRGRVRRLAREPRALPARGRARDAEGDRRRLPPPVQDQRSRRRQGALPVGKEGTTLEESIQVCKWLVEAGVDGLHISSGYVFPHPRNPAGTFPIADVIRSFDTMLSSGTNTFRNYLMFRTPPINKVFAWAWERRVRQLGVEGINLSLARAIKQVVDVPVLCAGGFQTASVIARAIEDGSTDGVTMGRPLIANPDLPNLFAAGPRPGAAAVHVLQQVPDQLRREPVGLLRGEPLSLSRRDDPPHHVGLRGSTSPGGGEMSAEAIFEPLRFRNLEVKNRILRSNVAGRLDDYDGGGTQTRDQLGAEVCPRRRRRDRLLLDRCRRARQDRPGLRRHRDGRAHPVLARAREARARARLPLHHPARPCGPPAGRADARLRQGALVDEQAGPAARLRGRARDTGRSGGDQALVRAGRPARPRGLARRRRDSRRQRLPLHAVPLLGDQRPRRTSTAARSRTAPASCSRPSRRSAARSATTSTSR